MWRGFLSNIHTTTHYIYHILPTTYFFYTCSIHYNIHVQWIQSAHLLSLRDQLFAHKMQWYKDPPFIDPLWTSILSGSGNQLLFRHFPVCTRNQSWLLSRWNQHQGGTMTDLKWNVGSHWLFIPPFKISHHSRPGIFLHFSVHFPFVGTLMKTNQRYIMMVDSSMARGANIIHTTVRHCITYTEHCHQIT